MKMRKHPPYQIQVLLKKKFGWKEVVFATEPTGYKIANRKEGKEVQEKDFKHYDLRNAKVFSVNDKDEVIILHKGFIEKHFRLPSNPEKIKFMNNVRYIIYNIAKDYAFSNEYLINEKEIRRLSKEFGNGLDAITMAFKRFQNLISELSQKIIDIETFFNSLRIKDIDENDKFISIKSSLECIKDEMMGQFESIMSSYYDERDSNFCSSCSQKFNGLHKSEKVANDEPSVYFSVAGDNEESQIAPYRFTKFEDCNELCTPDAIQRKTTKMVELETSKQDLRISDAKALVLTSSFLYNENNDTEERRNQLSKKLTFRDNLGEHEPLTVLQRECEKFFYMFLLNNAAKEKEKAVRMCYIAAFYIASLSLTVGRFLEPFSSILGETYEYIEKDKNFRYFSEGVSIDPPINAYVGENDDWFFFGDTRSKNSFRVLGDEIVFTSKLHLCLKALKEYYVITKPKLITKKIGEDKINYQGKVKIVDSNNPKDFIEIEFSENTDINKYRDFTGKVFEDNTDKYLLNGNWGNCFYYCEKNGGSKKRIWSAEDEKYLKNSEKNKMYYIPSWSCNLNKVSQEMLEFLPPTDSRLRPDLRYYEAGSIIKSREIEEKLQRKSEETYQEYEENKILYKPNYFQEIYEQHSDDYVYKYSGGYWEDKKNKDFSHLDSNFYVV